MIKPNEAGMKVYKEANCVGCHKWHGDGGGGYGGAALSLRATALTKEQIMEVVRCGRPNTGMPYFNRDAYAAKECYGVGREELGESAPMAGPRFLRPREIEAVVDYVLAEIRGKAEPNYADCTAFFGDSSRMCQHYRPAGAEAGATDAAGRPIGR
ncbi:cytochrome c [Roseicella frigidaeris]|uniref:Cytochrome c n=2 Tax=Roseicella frigidaeris TaxID=2230885 RepID=A0A327M5D2_9PROT|nr:cytochrome c [Roseicella frigidaeris]